MDPNNNSQSTNTNPLGQPVQQPTAVPPVQQPITPNSMQSTPPIAPTPITPPAEPIAVSMPPQAPKGGHKKIILLIILILLILGMGTYVFFVQNQVKTVQKTPANTSVVMPPTVAPTVIPATVEEVNVASPDADLKSIENDTQGL